MEANHLVRYSRQPEFRGARILITSGRYRGAEGLCLGKLDNGKWAITPGDSDQILHLQLEDHFSWLIDLSSDPERN